MNNQNLTLEYIFKNRKLLNNNKGDVFEIYEEWFMLNTRNKTLNFELELFLEEIIISKDLDRYRFALFTIQIHPIDFSKQDKHFELLFIIANSLITSLKDNEQRNNLYWVLYILTDNCIHHSDELDEVVKRNPSLIPEFLKSISKIKYDPNDGQSDIALAVSHSVGLIWHLPINNKRKKIIEAFLNHYDDSVVEEVRELISHLKNDNMY
ncbi:hypothetical protein LY01_01351 [Nonlabens xylanidelens]|uniref:Uncharacterized protein n=1 Tax=Nonlabens xylanidelens TaxID=191564 RepID=A0A2S6INJ0_9FLAO|nr:hypothetical protein [Nonlabens xylanidelens]PPK95758.1 hypothetical protein LY01_01351 [Nonlabens xylanidelens]PQJ22550.1 hypothetical protein BST94_02975 [Nonlabens xylanidelens]